MVLFDPYTAQIQRSDQKHNGEVADTAWTWGDHIEGLINAESYSVLITTISERWVLSN